MNAADRARFDALVEEALAELPESFGELLERVPLIVEDRPSPALLKDLGIAPGDHAETAGFCGLHSGLMNTERSVMFSGDLPNQIHLFREGILETAGGWDGPDGEDGVYEQVMITLLHEVGHEMGLDEDDLDELGYA